MFAPMYSHRSGGELYLYLIVDQLIKNGEECYVLHWRINNSRLELIYESTEGFAPNLEHESLPKDLDISKAIIICPDIIYNYSPFKNHKVALIFGHKDGFVWKQKVDRSNNPFIIAHSRLYESDGFTLFHPLINRTLYNTQNASKLNERHMKLIYPKKDEIFLENTDFSNCFKITRQYPDNKFNLALLLKHSQLIYMQDCFSALLNEALLCGCIPVVTHYDHGWSLEELQYFELPFVWNLQKNSVTLQEVADNVGLLEEKVIFYENSWVERVSEMARELKKYYQI